LEGGSVSFVSTHHSAFGTLKTYQGAEESEDNVQKLPLPLPPKLPKPDWHPSRRYGISPGIPLIQIRFPGSKLGVADTPCRSPAERACRGGGVCDRMRLGTVRERIITAWIHRRINRFESVLLILLLPAFPEVIGGSDSIDDHVRRHLERLIVDGFTLGCSPVGDSLQQLLGKLG